MYCDKETVFKAWQGEETIAQNDKPNQKVEEEDGTLLDDKMTNSDYYDYYDYDYLTKANKRWTRGRMALCLVTTMIVDEPLSASTDGRGGYLPAGWSETKQYSSLCSLFILETT